MQVVIEIAKRYVFELICGVCAAAGIALCLVGLGGMSAITEEMNQAIALQRQIEGMVRESNPVNEKAVAMAQAKIDKIRSSYDEVRAFVRASNRFEPLVEGAFPSSSSSVRLQFQTAFRTKIGSWLKLLDAGDVATEEDISREKEIMAAESRADVFLGQDPAEKKDQRDETKKDESTPPQENARVRAAIRNAKLISCYATPQSFQESAVSSPDGPMYMTRPPTEEELWYAQLEVWIQDDVVKAIHHINKTEADRLRSEKIDPWVGNLPIKEIVSIQTTTYYVKDGLSPRAAGNDKDRAYPPGTPASAFTGHQSNDLYELMQFSVKLIVDARDIPLIVAGLCHDSFHVPLRIEYEAVPADQSMEGKIYGDEPVVALIVDFETVFFSELYLDMIPDKILEELHKVRPTPPPTEGA